jgi:hypothetical protein
MERAPLHSPLGFHFRVVVWLRFAWSCFSRRLLFISRQKLRLSRRFIAVISLAPIRFFPETPFFRLP